MIRRFTVAAALASAAAWPSVARAQEWRVGVDAGQIRSTLDPSAGGARSIVGDVDYESSMSAFRLSLGIPTPSDSMRWGAIAGWKRLAITHDRVTTGLDLSGNAFLFRGSASVVKPGIGGILDPLFPPASTVSSVTTTARAFAAQALPMISVEAGRTQLQARAGVSYYDATTRSDARNRVAPLGELQLLVRATPAFAIVPLVRWVAPRGENSAAFAGLSGIVAKGPFSFSAQAGRWLASADTAENERTGWSLGSSLRVTNRASITLSARHDAMDPVYRNVPQTSWSIGASFLLHSKARRGVPPVAERDPRGFATISLPASRVSAPPRIAGDFNNWIPVAMEREGSTWRHRVVAAPGVYNYAFVAPDGSWYVPEGTPGRKDDGMGGQVAVVVIR